MRKRKDSAGFSFLEVIVALAILATGVLFVLSMITGSNLTNENSQQQATGYKACQDVMEALMNMDKATLLAQKTWQGINGPSQFQVPALDPTTPPSGQYTVTDITASIDASAAADTFVEIRVSLNWNKVRVMLTNRRYLP